MEHCLSPSMFLLPDEALLEEKPKVAKRKMLFIIDGFNPKDIGFVSLPSGLVKHVAVKSVPFVREHEDSVGQCIDLLQQYRFIHNLGYLPKQKAMIILLNPFSRLLECDYYYYRPFIQLLTVRHVVPLVVLNPADYIEPLLYVLNEQKTDGIPHVETTTSPAKAKQLVVKAIGEVVQSVRQTSTGRVTRLR